MREGGERERERERGREREREERGERERGRERRERREKRERGERREERGREREKRGEKERGERERKERIRGALTLERCPPAVTIERVVPLDALAAVHAGALGALALAACADAVQAPGVLGHLVAEVHGDPVEHEGPDAAHEAVGPVLNNRKSSLATCGLLFAMRYSQACVRCSRLEDIVFFLFTFRNFSFGLKTELKILLFDSYMLLNSDFLKCNYPPSSLELCNFSKKLSMKKPLLASKGARSEFMPSSKRGQEN